MKIKTSSVDIPRERPVQHDFPKYSTPGSFVCSPSDFLPIDAGMRTLSCNALPLFVLFDADNHPLMHVIEAWDGRPGQRAHSLDAYEDRIVGSIARRFSRVKEFLS